MAPAGAGRMIAAGWLAPTNCWDQTIVRRLFAGDLYPHGLDVTSVDGYPSSDGAVIVVPGRFWAEHTDRISEALARYEWVLAFRVSDEEDWFDIHAVQHPNLRWWVQTPRGDTDYGSARLLGVGPTPHSIHRDDPPEKLLDVFLAGQNTHQRRNECFATITPGPRRRIEPSAGFTQGMDPVEFTACMAAAKVAPCPSGAVSVDSFRFWEALEAHAVPIPDAVSPIDGLTDYWERIGWDGPGWDGNTISFYNQINAAVDAVLEDWPAAANVTTAWWMRQKRRYAHWLRDDLEALGAI